MRSKTSFFNKAIYKKNMTLYWPVWVCYLLYGLIKVPGTFWSGLRQSAGSGKDALSNLFSSISLQSDIYVAAVVAVITGMAMFGYLFSAKSANTIHALPVTRTQLYVTNVVSGLTCILVPQLLVFLVSVMLCLLRGITCVEYLACWLFGVMGTGMFFYSLVCFCVMLTGLLPALPFAFVGFNYLSVGLMAGIRFVLAFFGYGITYSGVNAQSVSYMLSPLACLTENVGFHVKYMVDNYGQMSVLSSSFEGTTVLLGYAAAALVLYVLAWYGYQKRGIEYTGDLFIFGWVRPLFRWGTGAAFGLFAGIVVSEFLRKVSVWISNPAVLALILGIGIVGFFAADMLVQKSFRVFCVRRLKECGLFALAMSAGFGLLYGIGCYEMQYIPDEEEIASAYVYMNYPVELQGADVKTAVEMHRQIIAHGKELERESRNQKTSGCLNLVYCLKDGKVVERAYQIYCEAKEAENLAQKVAACEYRTDSFMKYTVGCDYEQIEGIEEGRVESLNKNGNNETYVMDQKAAGKIYRAFYEDVKAGSIQKYNLENYLLDAEGTTGQYPSAYLTINFNHSAASWEDVFSSYQEKTSSVLPEFREEYESFSDIGGAMYVKFGADCKNIMKALVEEGVIPSEDAITFSAENET